MEKATLEAQIGTLVEQEKTLLANVNAVGGALQFARHLLATWDDPAPAVPQPSAPASPSKDS